MTALSWIAEFPAPVIADAAAHQRREVATIQQMVGAADAPVTLDLVRALERFNALKSDVYLDTAARVDLIERLLALVLRPDVPSPLLSRLINSLTRLIKKRKLPADALTVQWRPLYDMLHRLHFVKSRSHSTGRQRSGQARLPTTAAGLEGRVAHSPFWGKENKESQRAAAR